MAGVRCWPERVGTRGAGPNAVRRRPTRSASASVHRHVPRAGVLTSGRLHTWAPTPQKGVPTRAGTRSRLTVVQRSPAADVRGEARRALSAGVALEGLVCSARARVALRACPAPTRPVVRSRSPRCWVLRAGDAGIVRRQRQGRLDPAELQVRGRPPAGGRSDLFGPRRVCGSSAPTVGHRTRAASRVGVGTGHVEVGCVVGAVVLDDVARAIAVRGVFAGQVVLGRAGGRGGVVAEPSPVLARVGGSGCTRRHGRAGGGLGGTTVTVTAGSLLLVFRRGARRGGSVEVTGVLADVDRPAHGDHREVLAGMALMPSTSASPSGSRSHGCVLAGDPLAWCGTRPVHLRRVQVGLELDRSRCGLRRSASAWCGGREPGDGLRGAGQARGGIHR
ncbi:hypothetical protein Ae707Ps1_5990c [Pseudonocardia sp. Ae707_Ps1]|nr:hypothetical protein Ae707Ps1_5990c [Pseudonocardia sp. Ae707_Ps1]